MATDVSQHGMWSSRLVFVLAAAGSAVGLGNIWKFPYITGENGGGAFVVVYLVCIALIGVPIMMAEVMLGRAGRMSPINTMRALTKQSGGSGFWPVIGWMGVVAGFLILSYYAVIAGWAVYYIFRLASGTFEGADGAASGAAFDAFLANPWAILLWQTIFMAVTVVIIARGVARGLETAVRWLMPLLFVLLVVLVGYAAAFGDFARGAAFLFSFDASKLSVDGLLTAMGHAFFTLSLGMGAIMAYGAYLPARTSIASTVTTIAVLDTVVALVAGLAIFPIVFGTPGLEPGEGPGLMFVTLPIAFGNLPVGALDRRRVLPAGELRGGHVGDLADGAGACVPRRTLQRPADARRDLAGRRVLAARHRHGALVQRLGGLPHRRRTDGLRLRGLRLLQGAAAGRRPLDRAVRGVGAGEAHRYGGTRLRGLAAESLDGFGALRRAGGRAGGVRLHDLPVDRVVGTAVRVEVARATADGAESVAVEVAEGATAQDAVLASPFADAPYAALGVFGRVVPSSEPVRAGDRVELLSELLVEPKAARRARAQASNPPRRRRPHRSA